MGGYRSPVAIQLLNSAQIIDFVLKQTTIITTIVVCASRSAFLARLQGELQEQLSTPPTNTDEGNDNLLSSTFLFPSLHLLATSRRVHLAFTPTLPHLRAYLAAFNAPKTPTTAPFEDQSMSMLLILSLVDLHRSTSEYSAQGISRTLAIAVEAAELAGMKLVLGEYSREENQEDVGGEHVDGRLGASSSARQDLWEEQIPILSGSIRFRNDEGLRLGRTVSLGRVLGRWCRFVTMDTIISPQLRREAS